MTSPQKPKTGVARLESWPSLDLPNLQLYVFCGSRPLGSVTEARYEPRYTTTLGTFLPTPVTYRSVFANMYVLINSLGVATRHARQNPSASPRSEPELYVRNARPWTVQLQGQGRGPGRADINQVATL